MNVSVLQRKDYGAFAALGLWKNRPNQSQFASLWPGMPNKTNRAE
jgi:hypothetical protein